MEFDETLRTLYTTQVEERNGDYVLTIPSREIDVGTLAAGETYRVALLADSAASDSTTPSSASPQPATPSQQADPASPPVAPGDTRRVEIETLGDQGDGIARIERGFVVIVPDTSIGEQVDIEITSTTDSVAFGEVTARHSSTE